MRDIGIMLGAFVVGGLIAIIMANTGDDIGSIFVGLLCVLPGCLGAGYVLTKILRSRDRYRAEQPVGTLQELGPTVRFLPQVTESTRNNLIEALARLFDIGPLDPELAVFQMPDGTFQVHDLQWVKPEGAEELLRTTDSHVWLGKFRGDLPPSIAWRDGKIRMSDEQSRRLAEKWVKRYSRG